MNKEKRILFILHFPPPVHGSSLVGKFIKDSSIINEYFVCRYVDLGTSIKISEIGKGSFIKIFRYLRVVLKVVKELLVFRPRLCYLAISAKGGAFYKDAVVALFIRLLGIEVVYHFHNKGVKDNQEKFLDNRLYRLVFEKSYVILLSEHLYFDIQKYVLPERVSYCPNGIPQEKVSSEPKVNVNTVHSVQILFLSNLIKSKGVFILLQACHILMQRGLNFYCTFVGGEGDMNELQFDSKTVDLDLQNYVNYVGKKYGAEKRNILAGADIFALPTYYQYECFPLVLLEAMQFSLPIVSTYEGGIPEIVIEGETGFLVPQKDVKTFANKLEMLIINPKIRKKMGEEGRLKYEKEFTLPIFESRLKSILDNIIS